MKVRWGIPLSQPRALNEGNKSYASMTPRERQVARFAAIVDAPPSTLLIDTWGEPAPQLEKTMDDDKPVFNQDAVRQGEAKPKIVAGVLHKFPKALEALALVSEFGAQKWDTSIDSRAYITMEDGYQKHLESAGRHLVGAVYGKYNAADGGVMHLAQLAWRALAAIETLLAVPHNGTLGIPNFKEPKDDDDVVEEVMGNRGMDPHATFLDKGADQTRT